MYLRVYHALFVQLTHTHIQRHMLVITTLEWPLLFIINCCAPLSQFAFCIFKCQMHIEFFGCLMMMLPAVPLSRWVRAPALGVVQTKPRCAHSKAKWNDKYLVFVKTLIKIMLQSTIIYLQHTLSATFSVLRGYVCGTGVFACCVCVYR